MNVYIQVTEVYQERRLDAVFAMWDQNSDLRISFKELCEGLYRSAACYFCAYTRWHQTQSEILQAELVLPAQLDRSQRHVEQKTRLIP